MLLRTLSLKNIRSYNDGEETQLRFPEGVVLFEGDIGSGKSTLLYAIEFALFGFSDMKGVHLLSEGRKVGTVSLTFETDGTEYTVERRLKVRGDDVVQDECQISSRGSRERLSASDLKERIVSLLGFNEPTHPRAESLVYRYAVFTPQEQMKEILTQNAEERLHVIRRVLGAQSYQLAAENSEIVERRIREIGYGLRKVSEDLQEKKDDLDEKARNIARLEAEIPRVRRAEEDSARSVLSLESELREALGERDALGKSEAKVPLLKEELDNITVGIRETELKLQDLEGVLTEELEPIIKSFRSLKAPEGSVPELQANSDRAKERLIQLKESKRTLDVEITKTKDLIAKGVCPLCGQPISKDLHLRTEHTEMELERLENEVEDAEAIATSLAESAESAREFEEAGKEFERATKEKSRADNEIASLRKKIHDSVARATRLRSELSKSEAKGRALREIMGRVEALESRLGRAREQEKKANRDLTQAITELADSKRELEYISAEVKKKEEDLRRAGRLAGYQGWLSSYFRPTVELIEKQTLTQAASRFNEHFQRFFTTLVDDPAMVVRVKEDFTPVFEREGFEQDFEALSGGERTSMALAYRFALNSVVKESMASRPELVILDEPTDGFSKEQVYKMRGLLDELDSRQVILVSHERELESMADHIFRVEKRNGNSVVSAIRVHD